MIEYIRYSLSDSLLFRAAFVAACVLTVPASVALFYCS